MSDPYPVLEKAKSAPAKMDSRKKVNSLRKLYSASPSDSDEKAKYYEKLAMDYQNEVSKIKVAKVKGARGRKSRSKKTRGRRSKSRRTRSKR
tara:strand:- start:425 stop:700 length:276 start_codon:yes stop_codon:yes gene_type:complete